MPTHYQGNKAEKLALSTLINLLRAAESVSARTNEGLREADLTPGQFGVLEALYHLGPLPQCEVAQKLLRTGGNMTTVVDNLEKLGLVERIRGKEDRRVSMLHLTASGRELIKRIFPGHAKAVAHELSILSSEEQEMLRSLCRKLGKQQKE